MHKWIPIILFLTLFLVPVANAKIVFASNRSGNGDIFTMNDDGTNIQNLTNNPLGEYSPRWSPDGKRIVFQRRVNLHDNQRYHLIIINSDGTNEQQLTEPHFTGGDTHPVFSPDGKHILFQRYRGEEDQGLYILSLESNAVKKIHDIAENFPIFTPDGKNIIFSTVGTVGEINGINVHIMDTNGKKVRELLPPIPVGTNMYRMIASLSPDGKKLLYGQFEFENQLKLFRNGRTMAFFPKAFRIIISDKNGENPRWLNIPVDWRINSLVWMDKGKTVLFSADADYDIEQAWDDPERTSDIYKYDIAKNRITPLTAHPAHNAYVDWINDDILPVTPQRKKLTQWGILKVTLTEYRTIFTVFSRSFLSFLNFQR